ncbi:hypothetical protein BU24DRAFT_465058 [Aaosphaeria arxii CBS 175.79]|uniref:Uncharacterized protein n=1 Tax=Aaosphaeria arxii CBS 175.79 TaxID=1450172 RepID=A0A6A5XIT9_9PLEO|nr:uncharacterized protein BU24DRAFT_465058 [Aaosphaeria arxii CBS 175.79]KAF2012690.1 hypothetical protein BU24DRAFT_465058 [Aaosphaeria arxii CBS 175.79]
MSSSSTVHINAEDADADDNELVVKENGEYKMLTVDPSFRSGAIYVQMMKDNNKNEHENQLIALYEKQDTHWSDPAIMHEIKIALKSSLNKKLASLDADQWMFGGERK